MIPASIAILTKNGATPQEALESIRKLLTKGFQGFEYVINNTPAGLGGGGHKSSADAFMSTCLSANALDPSVGIEIVKCLEECREFWTIGYEDIKKIRLADTRVIGFMRFSQNLATLSLILENNNFISALKGGPAYTIPPPETEVRLDLDLDYPSRLRPRSAMRVCGLSWPTTHGDGDETILLTRSRSEIRWVLWLRTSLYDWFPESHRKILVMPIAWTRRDIDGNISAARFLLSAYFCARGEVPNQFVSGLIDNEAYKDMLSELGR